MNENLNNVLTGLVAVQSGLITYVNNRVLSGNYAPLSTLSIISGILTGEINQVSSVVSGLSGRIDDIEQNYATITYVDDTLTGYVEKEELETISGELTGAITVLTEDINFISTYVSGLPDKEYVNGIVSSYALSADVDTLVETTSGNITGWVNRQKYALSADVSGEIADIRSKVTSIFRFKGLVPQGGLDSITTKEQGDVYISSTIDGNNIEYIYISGDVWEQLGTSMDLSNYIQINDNISKLTNDVEYALSADVDTLMSTTSTKVISQIEQKGYLTSALRYENVEDINENLSADKTTFFYTSSGNAAIYDAEAGLIKLSNPVVSSFNDITTGRELATVTAITSWVDEQNYVTEADLGLTGYVKIEEFEITSGELTGGIIQVRNSLTGYTKLSTLEETSGILNNSITGLTAEVNYISSYVSGLPDKEYVNEIVSSYALSTDVDRLVSITSGNITGWVDEQGYALSSDIPLSTSQLINDSGFISSQMVDDINSVSANNTLFYTPSGEAAIHNELSGLIKLSNPILTGDISNFTPQEGVVYLASIDAITGYINNNLSTILMNTGLSGAIMSAAIDAAVEKICNLPEWLQLKNSLPTT